MYRVNYNTMNIPTNAESLGVCWTLAMAGNVAKAGAKYQVYYAYDLNYHIYYRYYSSNPSEWFPWRRIAINDEIFNSKSVTPIGYVRFGSLLDNLTIQWGSVGNPNNITAMNFVFPINFMNNPIVICIGKNSNNSSTSQQYNINTYRTSTAGFYIAAVNAPSYVDYIAIRN